MDWWFGVFRQRHDCWLYRCQVPIQVYYLNGHLQICQQGHYLQLVCLLIDWLHLELAKHLHWQSTIHKGLIEESIISELARCEESQHQDQIVGDLWIPEHLDQSLRLHIWFQFLKLLDE